MLEHLFIATVPVVFHLSKKSMISFSRDDLDTLLAVYLMVLSPVVSSC